MRLLTIIGVLLVISLVVTACGRGMTESDDSTEEPEFSLGLDEDDLETDDLDTIEADLDELNNLL